jgi:DNA-binding response OmpR family regulator
MSSRILLVEDDERIRASMRLALEDEGYEVDEAGSGEVALEHFGEQPADVVLIDLMLPGMDGFECCRQLRRTSAVPVIMVTARNDTHDVVAGLEAGADDYVTKPFRLAELLARVRALLRRNPTETSPSSDQLRIDPEGRRAWFQDQELQLTAKEFDLLRVLFREQGKVVSREQLMREIWETAWFGSTKTLDMHISVLRRKLGDDATQPRYISTVRGVGFRFERPED